MDKSQPETKNCQNDAYNPRAHDDFGFRPAGFLKQEMNRGNFK